MRQILDLQLNSFVSEIYLKVTIINKFLESFVLLEKKFNLLLMIGVGN